MSVSHKVKEGIYANDAIDNEDGNTLYDFSEDEKIQMEFKMFLLELVEECRHFLTLGSLTIQNI